MRISDLSEDERAVYLAAFGAYIGTLTIHDVAHLDCRAAAEVRALRAVRVFKESQALVKKSDAEHAARAEF